MRQDLQHQVVIVIRFTQGDQGVAQGFRVLLKGPREIIEDGHRTKQSRHETDYQTDNILVAIKHWKRFKIVYRQCGD